MAGLSVVSPDHRSPLADLVEDYLRGAEARGLAPQTVDNSYGYPLRRILLPWCHDQGISSVEGLDAAAVDGFSTYLLRYEGKNGRLSRHSIHAYARAVRTFLLWCKREGEMVHAEPQLPRLPRKVLDVLTWEEIEAMEKAAPTERDKLIIRVLAEGGLRATELCSLRIDDLLRRGRNTFLRVQGKGARERLVPLLPTLFRRVERYVHSYRPTDTYCESLFVSVRRGRSGDYESLTRSGVLYCVRDAARRAGIKKRVYTHLLRHSFFTNGLRGGMNTLLLAQIGGHSSLRMLQDVYSHLDMDDAYEDLARMLMKRR
jgi:integrase